MPAAVVAVALDRKSVVEPQRADRQIKAEPDADIRGDMIEAKGPRVAVDKPGVIEYCAAGFFDDRKSPFDGCPGHCLATGRFAIFVLWSNFAERFSSNITSASEKKALE